MSAVDNWDWNDRRGSNRLAVSWGAFALFISAGSLTPALGEGVTRDLSSYSAPAVTFTVSITIDADPTTNLVGIEEAPPTGWTVSAISNGGEWDAENAEVKWLFFSPPFPDVVTYDVTPPGGASGNECFSGIGNFDGIAQPITGDLCISGPVPTLSEWGLAVMLLLLLTTGSLLLIRARRADSFRTTVTVNAPSSTKR